jgi:putative aminopeptidase FrvX
VLATSKEEVLKMGIEIGNCVVFDRKPEILNDKYVIGKALDDKIGGFVISEVLRHLKEKNIELYYDLYVVNSVQEEVGVRGAKMITETIEPDVAICFDVCFDTNTPLIDKAKYGDFKMGDSVIFRQGFDVHPNLLKLMKETANEYNIPYKISVGGGGGTNTVSYNLSNGGVVTSTICTPLRYMHTNNEIVLLDDIKNSIDYLVHLLCNIENNHNFKLIK